MPTSDQQARAIAFLAAQCRPIDAPAWQEAGIVKQLTGDPRPLPDVILDAVATALDPEARTPGAIGKRPWRTRLLAAPSLTARPPRADEACHTCGRYVDGCLCDEPSTTPLRPADVVARKNYLDQMRAQLRPTTGDTDD